VPKSTYLVGGMISLQRKFSSHASTSLIIWVCFQFDVEEGAAFKEKMMTYEQTVEKLHQISKPIVSVAKQPTRSSTKLQNTSRI
jgi:hypothetical protein